MTIPAPRIVVIEDIDERPGLGAFAGAVHAQILQALGCVGLVTNGSVRDLPEIRSTGFQLFASNVAQVREFRAAYYPNANGSLTGAEAVDNNRIGAGVLNAPQIFDKYANGFSVNQLVTDFGRTHQLVKSSGLHARAQQENVVTSRADVLLQVDQSYFGVLRAQALLRVAQQTVSERQLVANQVGQLAANQLKSQLDVTFANVDLAQAQLLLIQAQNNVQASYADLTRALGFADQRTYNLAEPVQTPTPSGDLVTLLQQALMNRPELISQQFEVNSAQSFATAERDLWFPTISAVGAAGLIPFHTATTVSGLREQYAAAGFNVKCENSLIRRRLCLNWCQKRPVVPPNFPPNFFTWRHLGS